MRAERLAASIRNGARSNRSATRAASRAALHRRLRRRSLIGLGMLAVLCGATCRTPPPDPDGAQGQAVDRTLGETIAGSLDCRAGDCLDWHRIRIVERGTLRLEALAARRVEATPRVSISLADGFGEALEALEDVTSSGQTLARELDPGFYLIGVKAPKKTRAIGYELSTRFDPARVEPPKRKPSPPKKPTAASKPKLRRVDAEVLEVEGQLSQPTGVLLDLGRDQGVSEGLVGELLDGNRVVGQIRVKDVYDEGSRASVSLPLERPITPGVRAVLLIPENGGPGSMPTRDTDPNADPWSTEQDAFQP